MAKIVSINISKEKGKIKIPLAEGRLLEGFGLEEDAHGGNWHRQVSLLAEESIDKMRTAKPDLEPGVFAENLTTEGLILHELPIGTLLRVGEEAVLQVTQIGKECHHGCEIRRIVGDCVMPREGIFTIVKQSGVVRPGDEIKIETAESL